LGQDRYNARHGIGAVVMRAGRVIDLIPPATACAALKCDKLALKLMTRWQFYPARVQGRTKPHVKVRSRARRIFICDAMPREFSANPFAAVAVALNAANSVLL